MHDDPADPPRRRANKARGPGNWDRDRPPVAGVVGRQSGRLVVEVVEAVDRPTLQGLVERATAPAALVYTDELPAYGQLGETGRGHATVCHTAREWARDDDGDGRREVHSNTLEGIWTGLRNFLRPFRGVSKWYLDMYVALFQWGYLCKGVTTAFIQALFGLWPTTDLGP